jgi:hypothetical protein
MRDSDGNWYQDAYLKASNEEGKSDGNDYGDEFGISVAIYGDTKVVGALYEDSNQTSITNKDRHPTNDESNNNASDSGAVYVFRRDSNGNWYQDAYLKASNAEGDDYFGKSVAIYGDTIVVGAFGEDSNQTSITNDNGEASSNNSAPTLSGAVYVFMRDSDGNWYQDAYLKASNAEGEDRFSNSVAIYEDTIVVGAAYECSNQTSITNEDGHPTNDESNNDATVSGAVYVFTVK